MMSGGRFSTTTRVGLSFVKWGLEINTIETFARYEDLAGTFAKYPAGDFVYPILGLAGEAGEACNKIKKVIRDDNGVLTDDTRNGILDELGDTLWYVSAAAKEYGSSLGELATRNIDKLQSRRARGTLKGSGDNR